MFYTSDRTTVIISMHIIIYATDAHGIVHKSLWVASKINVYIARFSYYNTLMALYMCVVNYDMPRHYIFHRYGCHHQVTVVTFTVINFYTLKEQQVTFTGRILPY